MFVCQKRLVERKARICQHPDGKPSSAGADAFEKIMRVFKPVKMKWVDRGTRSAAGCQRDDYRRRFRRAKAFGFASVVDRWENDSKNDYEFRRHMMANVWTRETIEEIDRIASAPGQPEPKAGQGRNWLARAQHEGWRARVDGHGDLPEEPRPDMIPEYVLDRNARRRAET